MKKNVDLFLLSAVLILTMVSCSVGTMKGFRMNVAELDHARYTAHLEALENASPGDLLISDIVETNDVKIIIVVTNGFVTLRSPYEKYVETTTNLAHKAIRVISKSSFTMYGWNARKFAEELALAESSKAAN